MHFYVKMEMVELTAKKVCTQVQILEYEGNEKGPKTTTKSRMSYRSNFGTLISIIEF